MTTPHQYKLCQGSALPLRQRCAAILSPAPSAFSVGRRIRYLTNSVPVHVHKPLPR